VKSKARHQRKKRSRDRRDDVHRGLQRFQRKLLHISAGQVRLLRPSWSEQTPEYSRHDRSLAEEMSDERGERGFTRDAQTASAARLKA
jgi:hypothetical protein